MTATIRSVLVATATLALALTIFVFAGKPRDPLSRLRFDGRQYVGSIWIPRAGPVIVGFQSEAPAELAIDGVVVAEGSGTVTKRVVYDAGAHALRFGGKGASAARLLWHPPGRRGAPEYVPASSLSADPADMAMFDAPGTDRDIGRPALGLLIVFVIGAILLLDPFRDERALATGTIIFAVALAVRLYGLNSVGQTWDEDEYWSAGRNYLINLFAGDFKDQSWLWNYQHPPVTKYLAGVGAILGDGYTASRIIFAVLAALTCVIAWGIGRRLFGERAGLYGAIACALMPHLVAHARIVGHETPSVFFWTLAVYLALRVNDPDDAGAVPRWSSVAARLLGTGAAIGLAVGVRFPNLFVAITVAGVLLVETPLRRIPRLAGLGLVLVPVGAAAIFFAIWPRMWHDPLRHLDEAYHILKQPHLPETYLGHEVSSPPWHYFPVYVLATTPIVVLAFAGLAGLVRAAVRRERGWLVILLWLAAPFGVAWSPVRQDGVRYVLPALVPLAIACGAGLGFLVDRLRPVVFRVAAVALAGYLVFVNLRVQPYQLDYYNEAVGGPKGADDKRLFETGWWGEGLADAVEFLNARAVKEAAIARMVYPTHVTWFRGDLWTRLSDAPGPDTEWILLNDEWLETHPGFQLPPEFKLAHDTTVQGASLARVYHRETAEPR